MEICNITLAGIGICKIVGYPILFCLGLIGFLLIVAFLQSVADLFDILFNEISKLFSRLFKAIIIKSKIKEKFPRFYSFMGKINLVSVFYAFLLASVAFCVILFILLLILS